MSEGRLVTSEMVRRAKDRLFFAEAGGATYDDSVRIALEAVAGDIAEAVERNLREQIARDIEAERTPDEDEHRAFRIAAKVARGVVSR